jgi:hypothetical protein
MMERPPVIGIVNSSVAASLCEARERWSLLSDASHSEAATEAA